MANPTGVVAATRYFKPADRPVVDRDLLWRDPHREGTAFSRAEFSWQRRDGTSETPILPCVVFALSASVAAAV